jgi:hypothetical protein
VPALGAAISDLDRRIPAPELEVANHTRLKAGQRRASATQALQLAFRFSPQSAADTRIQCFT